MFLVILGMKVANFWNFFAGVYCTVRESLKQEPIIGSRSAEQALFFFFSFLRKARGVHCVNPVAIGCGCTRFSTPRPPSPWGQVAANHFARAILSIVMQMLR